MAKHRPARALFEALRMFVRKPATILYPFEKTNVDAKFRGRIIFDREKCIGCKLCEKDCPADAIKITQLQSAPSATPAPLGPDQKPIPPKREFKCEINLGKCIVCAQCVDTCPKKALLAINDFTLADLKSENLIRIYGDKK
ncbi:MAG: 4Fe-4S binding protein [Elusimicrobia bacterium]|nr:4Fe-4S binding protein [Elusimicrobiota bacterium]